MRNRFIDLQKLNPNWKFAADHGKASNPGNQPADVNHTSILLCPCCLNQIQKQPVSLWENSKELFFLGYGFPLFYNMLQFCIILVFVLIISNSVIMLYEAVNQNCINKAQINKSDGLLTSDISSNSCTSLFVFLSKSSHELSGIDILIRIVSWIGIFAVLIYFRVNQNKLADYHKERNSRLSDFCIILKNLPKTNGIQKKIKDFMNRAFKERHHIEQIILIPSVDLFHQKQLTKKALINRKKKFIKDSDNNDLILLKIESQITRINEDITKLCLQIEEKEKKDELESEKAIVILSTEQQKLDVVAQFLTKNKTQLIEYFDWCAYEVTLKQAPDPREIIWENANYPKNQRWLKVLLGWSLSLIFLALVTVIFYFLIQAKTLLFENSLQKSTENPSQYEKAVVLVYITIFLVQLFNKFVMKIFLHWFCGLEKPMTSSQLEFSYAFKYTLGMFFTTAVMTLAVETISFQNYTREYGVVEEESIMFFFNAFFANLLWIIHPQYYIRHVKRYFWQDSKDMTQEEANHLMEEFPYDMGKRYAEVLETMWFTFLYASLIPMGPFLTFIGLCIYYWIDKYNLLRRSKLNNTIQSKLPMLSITLVQLILVWKPVGDLIFDLQLRNQYVPSTFIMLGIGLIYVLFPKDRILKFLFHEKFNVKQGKYKDVMYKFNESYRTVNPIHKHLALDKFLERNKKHAKPTVILNYANEGGAGIPSNLQEIMSSTNENNMVRGSIAGSEYQIDYTSTMQIQLDVGQVQSDEV